MPNFITRLFSSGATKLVEGIGSVLDELITSKDEKLAAELKIKELIAKHEVEMETEITSRWASDMNSDSWLSKNVRPMVLIFLVVSTVILVFIDAGVIEFYSRRQVGRLITTSFNNSNWCLFWWEVIRKSKKQ